MATSQGASIPAECDESPIRFRDVVESAQLTMSLEQAVAEVLGIAERPAK
jgi:hypothetical protein